MTAATPGGNQPVGLPLDAVQSVARGVFDGFQESGDHRDVAFGHACLKHGYLDGDEEAGLFLRPVSDRETIDLRLIPGRVNDRSIIMSTEIITVPTVIANPQPEDIRIQILTPEQAEQVRVAMATLPDAMDHAALAMLVIASAIIAVHDNMVRAIPKVVAVAEQVAVGIERARPVFQVIDAAMNGGKDKEAA
ncbi:hypothetical protein [Azospirillum argentinense]|uniref:Uncharacterized protein n=1 Tax=Azospirillum brasilense TaxID=192 RepID=A0A4D8QE20_AZOBR|nr:hypothetical protein [Azospirillum argentinense]QCO07481.1 hypothetical protein D3867_36980 [Azospirillum argentinense]